jgi:hypothetical protein
MVDKTYLGVYSDENCLIPLETMDFGRLVLGEKYKFTWYLKNHSEKWILQNITLNESFTTDEIKASYPELLLAGEVAKVDITIKPSINRREPMYSKGLFSSELWIG